MASIHLEGILVDSLGDIDVGGVLSFTHLTTTGETIATTQYDLVVPPDGVYSIDVEYGQIRIDYTTRYTERFVGIVIVNSDSTATSIPELLNAAVPVTEPVILEMQGLVADAVTAKDEAVTAKDEAVTAKDEAVTAAATLVDPIRYFDSVTNLIASSMPSGALVSTSAYHSGWAAVELPPIGGADYVIKTQAVHGSAGDGVITHTLANGNVAVPVPQEGQLLASQCGAVMDGNATAIGATIAASYLYPARYYANALSPISQPTSGSERPFSATDTIDLVGVQAGIWYSSLHGYKFLVDGKAVVFSNCVVLMAEDDCLIEGMGMADTNIFNPNSDTTNNVGRFITTQANQNCLFLYYRGDGEPKQIRNMKLLGKVGYDALSTTDFRCVTLTNTNGWYPDNIWMSSASGGIVMDTSCSDVHLGFIVSEFLFTDSIRDDGTCDWNMMNGGNIWASQTATAASGINSGSEIRVANVRFNGFIGRAVIGGDGSALSDCEFYNQGAGSLGAISLGANSELNGCNVVGANSNSATVILGSDSRVIGGSYENITAHPVFDFVGVTAGENKNSVMTGVKVTKTSTSVSSTNVAIRDQIPGTSFVGGSDKLKISSCHFEGDKATISGCTTAIIDSTNTWSNSANEIQSPNGSFEKSFPGTALPGVTTTVLRVSKVNYTGGTIQADISGLLSGVNMFNCQINAIYGWATTIPAITEISNTELAFSATGTLLAVQIVADGNDVVLQIVNTGTTNYGYTCDVSVSGTTRGSVEVVV